MNEEIQQALADFLERFEYVFDNEWDFTLSRLKDGYIGPDGTFLKPNERDEFDNWANRGALLAAYRRLRELVGPGPYGN